MDLNFAELTTLERYKLLTGLVFPRPIAWVSTWGEDGVANCAPYSFFNVFSSDPALLILGFGLHPNGAPVWVFVTQPSNGTILLESEVGRGSTFTLMVPLNRAKTLDAAA